MSSVAEADADTCCANCGIAEVGEIKLKDCDGCDLVKYCSDKCTEDHREQHEEECKKREAELHDKDLFTQPDGSDRGECPICFLPMPLDPKQCLFQSCCSEYICKGCVYANVKSNGNVRCPFCRESWVDDEEAFKRLSKRVKANDPVALHYMGTKRVREGDYEVHLDIGRSRLNWEIQRRIIN